MNKITLNGQIRNIQPSHNIKNIEYEQADIVSTRDNGKEDIISIKYKKYSNKYKDGDKIDLTGNVRSYSQKLPDGKNKVSLYVFTYFDIPEELKTNHLELDGRICKIEPIRTTKSGKQNIHFLLANNLIIEETNQKLNSYLPCIAWGTVAKALSKLKVNDKIVITGELHSREYKKMLNETEFEYRVCHECYVQSFEVIE
jgi:primosomal replication protein N